MAIQNEVEKFLRENKRAIPLGLIGVGIAKVGSLLISQEPCLGWPAVFAGALVVLAVTWAAAKHYRLLSKLKL